MIKEITPESFVNEYYQEHVKSLRRELAYYEKMIASVTPVDVEKETLHQQNLALAETVGILEAEIEVLRKKITRPSLSLQASVAELKKCIEKANLVIQSIKIGEDK